uniref:U2-Theriditoxin-Lha1b_1 n=1 Tax=Latrodectus hasselti TaxID=256736 RepID=A0A482Z708_LATHA
MFISAGVSFIKALAALKLLVIERCNGVNPVRSFAFTSMPRFSINVLTIIPS